MEVACISNTSAIGYGELRRHDPQAHSLNLHLRAIVWAGLRQARRNVETEAASRRSRRTMDILVVILVDPVSSIRPTSHWFSRGQF
jgi:hypothetical protein